MRQAGRPIPIALTIAGSDSCGGAGIQADLKTFTALGVYGASVITALTAQNTRGVAGIQAVEPEFVVAQLNAVLCDLNVGAVKTGMLANAAIVAAVAAGLKQHGAGARPPLIVDPVMVATSGDALIGEDAVAAIIDDLAPLAALLTPNLAEAARFLGGAEARSEAAAAAQAKALHARAGCAVLVKGGHGSGAAVDLFYDGNELVRFERPRLDTPHTHGTGCVLSAAIAARLARGSGLRQAIADAKAFVWRGLQSGADLGVGQGRGPVDCLFAIPHLVFDAEAASDR